MTKLPGMSSKEKLTTPMTESEAADFFNLSSDKYGAAMDVEKYFSPVERGVCLLFVKEIQYLFLYISFFHSNSKTLFKDYMRTVDAKAELKVLRDSNSNLQNLNKDMLKSMMYDK